MSLTQVLTFCNWYFLPTVPLRRFSFSAVLACSLCGVFRRVHNLNGAFIYSGMSASIKRFFEDISAAFFNCKRKVILCCAVSVVGMVLGIVFFKISNYNWWYCNRYLFVEKLVYGSFFAIFLSYLLCAAVVCALLCVSLLTSWTQVFCLVTLFFVSLYFGANCCAVFECAGALLGVLYLLLLLAEQALNMLCCFLTLCNCPCKRALNEAIWDNKTALIVQIAAILVKLAIIFVLLRLITALI